MLKDPDFPQIPIILDTGLMLEIFRKNLLCQSYDGYSKLLITGCEIGEKLYRPGKRFVLSYKLHLQDLKSNFKFTQHLSALIRPFGSRHDAFDTCNQNQADAVRGIPAVSYLSEVDMMLWAFPYDRKLSHLPKLFDTERLAFFFSNKLTGLSLSYSEKIISVKADVVHYLPEQSCMIRYSIDVAAKQDNQKSGLKEITVYGKNYRDDSGLETYSIMKQLAEQSPHSALPLYYDADTNTLWQAQVPGLPFEWTTKLSQNHDLIKKIAACIASFHRCKINSNRRYGFAQINEQLDESVKIAASWDGSLGEQVQEIVFDLFSIHSRFNWSESNFNAPLHLDLKMGNLLISTDKAYLIDMDCVSSGDSLADTGSFIANLYLNGLRAGAVLSEIDKIVAVFIREYRVAADSIIDMPKLNWYIAAALIHEVLRRSLRQQNQERLKHLGAYIDLSRRYHAMCLEGIEHV